MRRTIDNSKKDNYYSQVNNNFVPLSSCNTTSMIMFLLGNNIVLPKYDGQPEDALTQITLSQDAIDAAKRLTPWFVKDGKLTIPAREIHTVLDWCTNKWLGRNVVSFTTDMKIEEMIRRIQQGQVLIVNGKFTPAGHVVCLVGFEYEETESVDKNTVTIDMIKNWIIDDPYGDWHTAYESHKGNGIRFTHKEFISLTQQYESNTKWAHYLI